MKKIIKFSMALTVAATIFASCIISAANAQLPGDPNQQPMQDQQQMQQDLNADNQSITYQTFYDDLSPYGTWIEYPGYSHVWHPNVEGDFRPYLTSGNWNYSTEGWIWNSHYNWGWAPFHYGRWIFDNSYGWLWIPGYDWSPAWVQWSNVDNYYGWAPLMPEVNVGMAFGSYRPAAFYWNFVGRDHIYDMDIYNRCMDRGMINRYYGRMNILNNFGNTNIHNHFYSRGPRIEEVQRFSNRRINPIELRNVNNSNMARVTENNMQVYRPTVNHPQPNQFRRIDNNTVKPVRTNQDRVVTTPRVQQQANVNRLPVHTSPASTFPKPNNNTAPANNNTTPANNNNRGGLPNSNGNNRRGNH